MNYAVVDIGNLKLLISDGKRTLYESNTLTRLGLRMHKNNNRLHPEHIKSTVKELNRCKEKINELKVKKTRVVSTRALREMHAGQKVAK